MKYSIISASLILAVQTAGATSLTIHNTFSANTAAVADEVNQNFNATKMAVDDNDTRITSLTSTGNESMARISVTENALASNDARITDNTSAIANNDARITSNANTLSTLAIFSDGLHVIKDTDASVVGILLSSDMKSWLTLNSNGYLVRLTANGSPASETIYFTGSNCTGTPYLLINNTGGTATPEQANSVYAKQGYVFSDGSNNATYYIAKSTPLSSSVLHMSRLLTTGCQSTINSIDAIQANVNVFGTTGVPDNGYGGISLQ